MNAEKRLAKIKGQIHGIEKMLADERDCTEIIQQVIAVRSALTQLGKTVVQQECQQEDHCEDINQLLNSLFKLI